MLSERIRNAPLLTRHDAESIFASALSTLIDEQGRNLFSMQQVIRAISGEASSVIAASAEEIMEDELSAPWMKKAAS